MTSSHKLQLGSVVKYNNEYYLALAYDGHLVKIMAPHVGNRKLQVSRKKVEVVPTAPADLITFEGNKYLLTKKGLVVSTRTGRIMADSFGQRVKEAA